MRLPQPGWQGRAGGDGVKGPPCAELSGTAPSLRRRRMRGGLRLTACRRRLLRLCTEPGMDAGGSDLQQTPSVRAGRHGPLQPQQSPCTEPGRCVPAVCTCICPCTFLHLRTCVCAVRARVCASTSFCACEPLVHVCTHLRAHVSALPARCPEGPQLHRGGPHAAARLGAARPPRSRDRTSLQVRAKVAIINAN